MASLKTAALRYAELGYRVLPCVPGRKQPMTAHGIHDATSNVEIITQWWDNVPNANIGIATDGLLVVDIDGGNNQWPGSPDRAADLASAGAIATTPRGGRHYFFRRPSGHLWRCSAGRLADHVDIRTDGGYIIVSPSVTADGVYRWAPAIELEDPLDRLPEPPQWLIDELDAVHSGSHQADSPSVEYDVIAEGRRNSLLTSLAGTMRRVGMSQQLIADSLRALNTVCCDPPLDHRELDRIATSIGRYAPAPQPPDQPSPQVHSLRDLIAKYPNLREPVIHGLARRGEIINVIAAPKVGKSWLAADLALSVATGRPWLGIYHVEPGKVLVIDNELHPETIADRISRVMSARGITIDEVGDRIDTIPLRGHWRDAFSLGEIFQSVPPRQYSLIIIDAFYRTIPIEMDENSNSNVASLYNCFDSYALSMDSVIMLVHHTTKGSQADKAVTDVGAGAGSQSRAADTHLVLRPHEEEGVAIIDAVTRSWPPQPRRCLRWTWPIWEVDDTIDPGQLKAQRKETDNKVPPKIPGKS